MKLSKFYWVFPFLSFILGYFIINLLFNTKEKIEVPYIIGKSILEATKILSDNNLNIRILYLKEEPDLIPGTVIVQKPINQKVKQNQTIYTVISKKPELLKMPDLTGKYINDIQEFISKKNIKAKIYYCQSILPENICIAQFPQKNEGIEDKKILIYISSGNDKEIIFPNFKNIELKKVLNLLNLNNIKVKLVMKNQDKEYNPQHNYLVIDQRPFAGSLIKLSSNLNVQLIIQ